MIILTIQSSSWVLRLDVKFEDAVDAITRMLKSRDFSAINGLLATTVEPQVHMASWELPRGLSGRFEWVWNRNPVEGTVHGACFDVGTADVVLRLYSAQCTKLQFTMNAPPAYIGTKWTLDDVHCLVEVAFDRNIAVPFLGDLNTVISLVRHAYGHGDLLATHIRVTHNAIEFDVMLSNCLFFVHVASLLARQPCAGE
jgi:hypothetical protein